MMKTSYILLSDSNNIFSHDYNYARMNSLKASILPNKTKDYKNVLNSIHQYFSNSISYKKMGKREKLTKRLQRTLENDMKKDSTPHPIESVTSTLPDNANSKISNTSSCDMDTLQALTRSDCTSERSVNAGLPANGCLQDDENNNVQIQNIIQGSLSCF